ncbi:hypothetical protein FACS1894169_07730 [Bacteroidia bacterium]|nr:hypothetical protein FACS1894169_07730 [Bacteroidia bacterium]
MIPAARYSEDINLDELLETKLKALYQRKKTRDLKKAKMNVVRLLKHSNAI